MPSLRLFEPTSGGIKVDQITESRISTVISMLPVSLQSRMGPIRPFRESTTTPGSLSEVAVADDSQLSESEQERPRQLNPLSNPPSQPLRPRLRAIADEGGHSVTPASGIRWKFAQQGKIAEDVCLLLWG